MGSGPRAFVTILRESCGGVPSVKAFIFSSSLTGAAIVSAEVFIESIQNFTRPERRLGQKNLDTFDAPQIYGISHAAINSGNGRREMLAPHVLRRRVIAKPTGPRAWWRRARLEHPPKHSIGGQA
jgi:hypothetical protein